MKKVLFLAVSLLLSACQQEVAQQAERHQHAVASAHPVATQAGIEILNQGGNAFDAAVAVSAVLAVVEPYSSGMGGGGFWLLHRASDRHEIMIDGREKAPGKAHRDMYLDEQGNVSKQLSLNGPLAAGIPGQPAALVHISKRYGKLPLSKTLQPAIDAANNGFKVTTYYQRLARFRVEVLRQSPDAARIFLHNNNVPPAGHVIKQPELANTLQSIAHHGNAGFYEGEVADKLIAGIQGAGGIWTHEDLKAYRVKERQPLKGKYGKYTITSVAPPSSGGVALLSILNMLSLHDYQNKNTIDRKHLLIEAMRRAYRDRSIYLGDSDFVDVPIEKLTSLAYAQQLAEDINMQEATPSTFLEGNASTSRGYHTTHFSIMDKDGNRVAGTLSINYPFGACFVAPGTGVLLNDEMDDFSVKPGSPNAYGLVGAEANAIAPHKRMLSSMSPSFVESDDMLAVIGTPGGSRIITMVLHGILGFTEGKSATEIVAQPRFHHQYLPDEVQYEDNAFSDAEIAELEKRGHTLRKLSSTYGDMHVVMQNRKTGELTAASDPRGIGKAIVQ
jgi:gamma-glutamyltranspeptidase/glutathione hydrolase